MPRENSNGVGYGKPPRSTQFKPGQSGNPKGRPKGSRNTATIVDEAMKQQVTIREHGRSRTVSAQKAMIQVLLQKGLKGDHKSIQTLLQLQAQNEAEAAIRSEARQLDSTDRAQLIEILRQAGEADMETTP